MSEYSESKTGRNTRSRLEEDHDHVVAEMQRLGMALNHPPYRCETKIKGKYKPNLGINTVKITEQP